MTIFHVIFRVEKPFFHTVYEKSAWNSYFPHIMCKNFFHSIFLHTCKGKQFVHTQKQCGINSYLFPLTIKKNFVHNLCGMFLNSCNKRALVPNANSSCLVIILVRSTGTRCQHIHSLVHVDYHLFRKTFFSYFFVVNNYINLEIYVVRNLYNIVLH